MDKYNTFEFECDNCGEINIKNKRMFKKNTKNYFCNQSCHYEFKRKRNYQEMCNKVNGDFKEWIIKEYWDKERATRDISNELYGTIKNSPNVLGWMKKLGIPTRSRTDAVALQWKDDYSRRKQAGINAIKYMGAGTPGRKRLIKSMQSESYKVKHRISKTGERNGMWNPKLSEEERAKRKHHARQYPGYKEFRISVYERDKYTCQVCSDDTGGNLVVHHLNGFHWDENGRTDINNGVTLCNDCHDEFHRIYGRRDNNFFQFSQFQTSKTLTV